jgi:hypothetical protein
MTDTASNATGTSSSVMSSSVPQAGVFPVPTQLLIMNILST